jgi:hypothetical protein
MALTRFKAWKVITDDPPPSPESVTDTPTLDAACGKWLLKTHEEQKVTAQDHCQPRQIPSTISKQNRKNGKN